MSQHNWTAVFETCDCCLQPFRVCSAVSHSSIPHRDLRFRTSSSVASIYLLGMFAPAEAPWVLLSFGGLCLDRFLRELTNVPFFPLGSDVAVFNQRFCLNWCPPYGASTWWFQQSLTCLLDEADTSNVVPWNRLLAARAVATLPFRRARFNITSEDASLRTGSVDSWWHLPFTSCYIQYSTLHKLQRRTPRRSETISLRVSPLRLAPIVTRIKITGTMHCIDCEFLYSTILIPYSYCTPVLCATLHMFDSLLFRIPYSFSIRRLTPVRALLCATMDSNLRP